MNRLLVAHGSRRPAGVRLVGSLAERVGRLLDAPVQVAFVDVVGPTPAEVLGARCPGPVAVVPAFLSRGYHVRTDLPAHVLASGHPEVTVTPAVGPSRALVALLAAQLADSGWRRGDAVILAAAGSSDPLARADLDRTAALLAARLGTPVQPAFAATGTPSVAEAVRRARERTAGAVAVVSYLLADGVFQDRLHASGADLVTAPLAHRPQLAHLVAGLFRCAALQPAA